MSKKEKVRKHWRNGDYHYREIRTYNKRGDLIRELVERQLDAFLYMFQPWEVVSDTYYDYD